MQWQAEMSTCRCAAQVFAGTDKSTIVADEWNSTQIHVSDIGSDTVNRSVAFAVDLVTIVMLVSRRRLIDHQQGVSFEVDGLA